MTKNNLSVYVLLSYWVVLSGYSGKFNRFILRKHQKMFLLSEKLQVDGQNCQISYD